MPLADTLVYCVSCTCLFSCLQHCIVCARVCKCNVHGAPLSPGGLLHSPLVTLLPLARWQHCALCAFSHGKRLLLHAHFCILHSAILYLHCICIHISAQVHCGPLGAPLVTRRTFAAESPHFTSHFPSSLHLTFITSLRSIRRWSRYSENNHFPPSNGKVDFFLVDWLPIHDVRHFCPFVLYSMLKSR